MNILLVKKELISFYNLAKLLKLPIIFKSSFRGIFLITVKQALRCTITPVISERKFHPGINDTSQLGFA